MGNLFFDEPHVIRETVLPHNPLGPIMWGGLTWRVGDWVVRTGTSAYLQRGQVCRIAGFPDQGYARPAPHVLIVGHEHRSHGTFCLNYFRPATAAEIPDHG